MTYERMGEIFKGDPADMGGGKFPLVLMGGRGDQSSVRRRGARTPIGACGNIPGCLQEEKDNKKTKFPMLLLLLFFQGVYQKLKFPMLPLLPLF